MALGRVWNRLVVNPCLFLPFGAQVSMGAVVRTGMSREAHAKSVGKRQG